jgi:NAD+ synthase (glutamine-hydrolysing)
MDIKIALAQINVTVGDLPGNARKILDAVREAKNHHADIILFPEMTLCAYPPRDLILENNFIHRAAGHMDKIAGSVSGITAIVGSIHAVDGHLYNAMFVLQDGKILDVVHKTHLPVYDVFDEPRYFKAETRVRPVPVDIRGSIYKLGIEICEDLWDERYHTDVTRELAQQGADIILNASASPFCRGKFRERREKVLQKVRENGLSFVYLNLTGAQDELIFDGNSFALDSRGKTAAQLPSCREALTYCVFRDGRTLQTLRQDPVDELEELYHALILGIRDYFCKSGFRDAVIGLSGGIDSALVAALATEALGPEHVLGYAMPSKFSSEHSIQDAETLAKNAGIAFEIIPVNGIFEHFLKELKKPFAGTEFGLAEENLQARIRGSILMSIANKKHALVLTTGNKTELALGYCTLYGDMCGALAPISDLNKPDVYRLSRYVNTRHAYDLIPENTLNKRPSAELAEDQYDPFDYDIIGPLVDDILESNKDPEQLIRETGDEALVYRVADLIRLNEYKRRQAAPGLKVCPKAFGPGRKMPLVNHFSLKHS